MHQTQKLLLASQVLLWLQLLLQGQLQPLLAIALPALMVLQLRPPKGALPRPWLLVLTAGLLLGWGISQALGASNGLLHSISNLLWLMLGLQQLEAKRHEQQQRSVLLLLLGIGLAGLGSQGLAASLMQASAGLLALAGLHSLESGGQRLLASLRRVAILVAIALPLLLASFVLLPRLEPLWSLPASSSGRSGLSERLAPGELASLVQDSSLAARVSFAAAGPPPAEQRYWRVLVHQRFDGRSWSAADNWHRPPTPAPTTAAPLGQRWIVEPSKLRQQPWDGRSLPLAGPKTSLQVTDLGTLESSAPQGERQLYNLATGASSASWQLRPPAAIDLQLPAAANPRLQALGRQWGRQAGTPEARIALAQQWFGRQGFAYSLEPGQLGSLDPLDRFLFETRRGFCEHYAASFSALMRAAGVPARVVVGYQGGEWQQPAGDAGFLQLSNSDAHAWSEVWLPERGWVEVDPTAWVVPERIRRSQRLSKPLSGWLRAVATEWQGLDYRWQLWVMGFDRQRQLELLGQQHWQGLVALAAMALTLAGGLAALWRPWQHSQDRTRRCLNQTLQLLQRHGHQIHAGEALACFCQRVGQAEPTLATELQLLAALYEQWRFGPATSSGAALLGLQASRRRIKACLARGRRHSA